MYLLRLFLQLMASLPIQSRFFHLLPPFLQYKTAQMLGCCRSSSCSLNRHRHPAPRSFCCSYCYRLSYPMWFHALPNCYLAPCTMTIATRCSYLPMFVYSVLSVAVMTSHKIVAYRGVAYPPCTVLSMDTLITLHM